MCVSDLLVVLIVSVLMMLLRLMNLLGWCGVKVFFVVDFY